MSKELMLPAGTSEVAHGWTVTLKEIRSFEHIVPGDVSTHEGIHTLAALLTPTLV